MRKLQALLALVALTLVIVTPTALWAQGGGSGAVAGTVQDERGGVITNATISVISKSTGQKVREASTTGAGTFSVPSLPPGEYRVEIAASGFSKYVVDPVLVRVTETSTITASMKIGPVDQTVTVTETPTAIQLSSATTGQTLGAQTIANLPLATGNYLTLLTLSAGANTEIFDATQLGRGKVTINVNGQRPTNNNYQLEGINSNDVNLPIFDNVPLPNRGAIEEFKAQTSLYDASYGRNAGGNILVGIKSGTDHYHGDVFEFFRNDVLNANTWALNNAGPNNTPLPRPVLRQNQYGGSFGGPVPKIKSLFFFGNYQGSRASSGIATGTIFTTQIPVLPTVRSQANLIAAFFPGGLPPGFTSLDARALAFLNLPASKCPGFNDGTFCIPSLAGAPGITAGTVNRASITRSSLGTAQDDQFVISTDKQFGSKDKFTGRYFYSHNAIVQPFGGGASLPFPRNLPGENRFVKLGWTHILSSRTVNDFRFGLSRFIFNRVPTEPILLTDIGATRGNSADFPAAYQIRITAAGAPTFSLGTDVNDDRFGAFNTFVAANDFSHTVGKHTFRAGFDTSRYQLNRGNRFATRGSVSFGPSADGLIGFQNFLLGRITTTQGGAGFFTFHFRATDVAGYIQDDWKMTPRFTVNLGLRYEGLSVANEKDNFLSNFRGLKDGTTGPISIIHPEKTANVGTPGVTGCTLLKCFRHNFAPRGGFAWDIFGDQKTVLRGGAGIYYQRVSNQPLLQTSGGLPFNLAISADEFSVTTDNPFPTILPQSAFPLPNDLVIPRLVSFDAATGAPIFQSANGQPFSGFFFFPVRDFRPPYSEQWNFGIQRQLHKSWVLELGYVGTHGVNLLGPGGPYDAGKTCQGTKPCIIPPQIASSVTVPAGTPFVTKNADGSISITATTRENVNARVPVQFLGLANNRGQFGRQEGNSLYHALQATLSHQWSNGLYFQGAYTFSKSLDNGSGSSFDDELNGFTPLGDFSNTHLYRARSDFDRLHRFVVSYNYDLPFAKWTGISNQGLGKIVNGWSVNGVTIFQSGTPFNVFDSTARTLADPSGINTGNFATLKPGVTLDSALTSGDTRSRIPAYLDTTKFLLGGNCVNNQNVVVACTDPSRVLGLHALGNVGRNPFRGPFQQSWDLSLIKKTNITERFSVDFRAEAFNVFNHPSFQSPQAGGGPYGNFGLVDISGSSAIINTITPPRIIQFALKLNF